MHQECDGLQMRGDVFRLDACHPSRAEGNIHTFTALHSTSSTSVGESVRSCEYLHNACNTERGVLRSSNQTLVSST